MSFCSFSNLSVIASQPRTSAGFQNCPASVLLSFPYGTSSEALNSCPDPLKLRVLPPSKTYSGLRFSLEYPRSFNTPTTLFQEEKFFTYIFEVHNFPWSSSINSDLSLRVVPEHLLVVPNEKPFRLLTAVKNLLLIPHKRLRYFSRDSARSGR